MNESLLLVLMRHLPEMTQNENFMAFSNNFKNKKLQYEWVVISYYDNKTENLFVCKSEPIFLKPFYPLSPFFPYKNCQSMKEIPSIKRGIDFNFNCISQPINYKPCDCKGKYQFKKDSSLLKFLQNNNGWVSDPQNLYTLNYILICLIANFKEKGFLNANDEGEIISLKINSVTREILNISPWQQDYFSIFHLRSFIANAHLEDHRFTLEVACPPFSCTKSLSKKEIRLIFNLLNVPLNEKSLFKFLPVSTNTGSCVTQIKVKRKIEK